MSNRLQIPYEWEQYRTLKGAYFVTYYGDIYFGWPNQFSEYQDRIFIIQNDKTRTVQGLKPEGKNLISYQKLGREIRQIEVVKDYFSDRELGQPTQFNIPTIYDQKIKKMFVFGAAASTFCVSGPNAGTFRKSKFNPPTGYEIFDTKYDSFCLKYPGAVASISSFELNKMDIEGCLEGDWSRFRYHYNPQVPIRHINIQYYLQDLFQTISEHVIKNNFRSNLYGQLLTKLQTYLSDKPEERIAMVSFNYDTILDNFIQNIFGIKYDQMQNYIDWNKSRILLFKPHGSSNWGWRFRKDRINGNNQATIAQALLDGKVEPWQIYYHLLGDIDDMVASNSWGHESEMNKESLSRYAINKNKIEIIPDQTNEVFHPALQLPYRDKDEFVMPYNHYESMKQCMGRVEELYLIGWKGNEELFNWKLVQHAHSLKKIVIVNPNSEEVKTNLKKYDFNPDKYETVIVDDFEKFVLNYIENENTVTA